MTATLTARRRALAPALSRLSTSSEIAAQRLEHAGTVQRVGRELRHAAEVERVGQLGRRRGSAPSADPACCTATTSGTVRASMPCSARLCVQVLEALDVLLELARLAVGDEHDAVRALEHELARGLVVDLPGHGVELELRREAGDRAEVERQEVEEQRAVGLRRERDHLAFPVVGNLAVDVMQVRRLSRPTRSVVDDLAGDLARGVVDERHDIVAVV